MSKKKALLIVLTITLIVVLISCELLMEKPQKPNVKVLLVALDYDKSADFRFTRLDGTIRDAKEMGKALKSLNPSTEVFEMYREGDQPPLFETDDYPTKDKILAKVGSILGTLNENDLFIFYYAGHGYKGSGDLAVASDTAKNVYETLKVKELLDEFNKIDKGHAVLILDSCYSGQFVPSYNFDDKHYNPNLLVFSASSSKQDSYETTISLPYGVKHYHGVFTNLFLEAIGWDHGDGSGEEFDANGVLIKVAGSLKKSPVIQNGTITFSSIFSYVSKRINKQRPFIVRGPIDKVLYSEKW